jgi:hypothetical protein
MCRKSMPMGPTCQGILKQLVPLTEPAGPQSLLGKIAERAIWPKPADATHHNLTGLSLEIGESKTPGYEDSTNGWVQ